MRNLRALVITLAAVAALAVPSGATAFGAPQPSTPNSHGALSAFAGQPQVSAAKKQQLFAAGAIESPNDQVYEFGLHNDLDRNRCLDAYGPGLGAAGDVVQTYDCIAGDLNQAWYVDIWGDGSGNMTITSAAPAAGAAKYLDADTHTFGNGGKVQLWTAVPGNTNQVWYIWQDQYSDNCLLIQNDYGPAGTDELDADTHTYYNNPGIAQIWQYVPGNLNQQWCFYDL